MSNERPTIGILYPGEMGSSLGRLLLDGGFRVVTTLAGRSERTCRACREAGLEVLTDVPDVVSASGIVISLVPPAAALEVCRRFRRDLPPAGPTPMYIDANSVSPRTAREIERELARSGVPMVDASIHGLASRLRAHGTLYLSGPDATTVERLFGHVVRVKCLGDTVGSASIFKMLLSGMSKGLIALFLEAALTARRADLCDEFLETCRAEYAGVMSVIDRMLPTYPQHARRRGEEMGELEASVRSLGLRPGVVHETHRLTTALGESVALAALADGDAPPSVREIVEQLDLEHFLRDGKAISCAAGAESIFEAR